MPEHPESFPVNALVPIEGTPLESNDVSYGDFHTATIDTETICNSLSLIRLYFGPSLLLVLCFQRQLYG